MIVENFKRQQMAWAYENEWKSTMDECFDTGHDRCPGFINADAASRSMKGPF